MVLCFFDVDTEYTKYLQSEEKRIRGFSKVPNMEYSNEHERKMVCGIVLDINGYNYYVPVSSYKRQQSNNILIKLEDDEYNKVKGSLRFNYMFPVKEGYVNMRDFNKEISQGRKLFLHRQLVYCDSIREDIYTMAKRTYEDVVNKIDEELVNNSCDFKLLESACEIYKAQQEVAFTDQTK